MENISEYGHDSRDMESEHAQVFRIGRLRKNPSIILDAAKHNLREIPAKNCDQSLSHLNKILQGACSAADVANMAQTLMDNAKAKIKRKDQIRGLEIIVSLPPDTAIDQAEFWRDSLNYIKRKFPIPILSAAIHNDEAAPHLHVILLPLIDGCLNGSEFFGSTKYRIALGQDFHAQVGQRYGLKLKAPSKPHSATVRREAADMLFAAIDRVRSDNAIRLLLNLLARDPEPLIQELGLTMPRKQSKHKTFAAILTQNCPERKPERKSNPIGFENINPIGFDVDKPVEKDRNLSCVGFQIITPVMSPDDNPQLTNQDEYVREREEDHSAGSWNSETGEYIRPPITTKPKSAKFEQAKITLATIAARKRSNEARTTN